MKMINFTNNQIQKLTQVRYFSDDRKERCFKMKKTFKRLTAVIMAVTSLAVGVTGIGASAANDGISPLYQGPMGYVSFGNSARAGIYADSSQINLTTEDATASNVTVKIIGAGYTSLSENPGITYSSITYVALNCYGTGIKYVEGHHTAIEKGVVYSVYTSRSVG